MAAIDELKTERDLLQLSLDAARAEKQQLTDHIGANIQPRIDALVARKTALVQAIRDLTDSWNPAP